MAFKYNDGGRTAETIKREAAESSSGSYDDIFKPGTIKYKPRDGENTIRIMPATASWDVDKWGNGWGIRVWYHDNIGVDNATYLCLDKMSDGKDPCPICESRERVADDKDESSALKARQRLVCYVIDRDNEKEGPQVWAMPNSVSSEILARSVDRKTGAAILIDHHEEGYDVLFRKTGSGLKTDYGKVDIERDSSYLCQNERRQEDFLEAMMEKPLPSLLVFHEYEYLKKVASGRSSRREEDKDDRRGGRDRDDRRGGRDRERDEEDRRGRSGRGRDDDDGRDSRRGGREEERGRDEGRGRDRDDDRGSRRGRGESEEREEGGRGSRRGGRDEETDSRRSRSDDDGDRRSSRGGDGDRRSSRGGDDDRRGRESGREDGGGREERRSSRSDDGDRGEGRRDSREDSREGSGRGEGSRDDERSSSRRSARSDDDGGARRSSRGSSDDEKKDEKKDEGRGSGGVQRERSGRRSEADEADDAKEQIRNLRGRR